MPRRREPWSPGSTVTFGQPATTSTRAAPPPSSPIATTRSGAASSRAHAPFPVTTTGTADNLDGYNGYFGVNATDGGGKSYYSYDIPSSNWHIVNLDSECAKVTGGCAAGSPQELWLKADLAANSTKNVIAIWHKPRFSSGVTGVNLETELQPFYEDIYAAGVDILLDGHDHIYERLAPMDRRRCVAVPTRPTAFASSRSAPAARATTARDAAADERGPQRHDIRGVEAHPPRDDVRLGVPADRRQHLHGLGHWTVHAAPPAANGPGGRCRLLPTPQDTAKVVAAPGVLGQRHRCE